MTSLKRNLSDVTIEQFPELINFQFFLQINYEMKKRPPNVSLTWHLQKAFQLKRPG